MKLSNIKRDLRTDCGIVECIIDKKKKAIIKFNKEYFEYTDLSYDGFLILVLPLAMKNHEHIYIDGKISFRLYYKLIHNIMPIIKIVHPDFKIIDIHHNGFNTEKFDTNESVGCGISCGVDSLCCIEDFYFNECGEYKLTHLTNFNAGSYTYKEVYRNKLINIKNYIKETSLDFLQIDSNFSVINNLEHQYFHTLRNLSIPLFFQRLFKKYYYASCFTYQDSKCVPNSKSITSTEPILIPLLSTDNLEFIMHGCQYSRVKKTEIISKNPLSFKHLDVCVDPTYYSNIQTHINCSKCFKCMRTLFTMEYLNVLENFTHVFDIDVYFKYKFDYLKTLVDTNPYDRELKRLIHKKNHLLTSTNKIDTVSINYINNLKNDTSIINNQESITTETNKDTDNYNISNNIIFWYAYKNHWNKIDEFYIECINNTFIKINKDENSNNLDHSQKIEVFKGEIYRLYEIQNICDYYILYF